VKTEDLLVIGYGNPLRGDDATGTLAARRLAERGFRALAVHQLTPELAETIAAARAVVFLDADATLQPGEIAVEALGPPAAASPLEHHAGPAALRRLARIGYGAEPAAWLIRMGGESFAFGDPLSPRAETAVSRAVEAAAALIT
jgi:hydrogenase maturation protease